MDALYALSDSDLIDLWERCRSLSWREKQDVHDELTIRIKIAGILRHGGRHYFPTDDGSFKWETVYAMDGHRRPRHPGLIQRHAPVPDGQGAE